MVEWKEYKLGDVYEFSSGLSKPREEFGFGYGFLSYMDIFDNYFVPKILTSLVNSTEKERESCSVIRGDVFLTRTSETDEDLGMSSVALVDYPNVTFNGFTKRLRPNGTIRILPEYAGFFFRSPRFRATVSNMSSMTTRASLNNAMLSELTIDIPSIEMQASIAETLISLHEKIDLLQRQNKTLEALAETLFRQWFVPARRNESEGGEEAEEGWDRGTIEDEFGFTMGQSPSGSALNEAKNGMVFFQGRTDFGVRFPEPRVYTTEPTRLAKKFDTLVSVRAPVGDMNIAIEDCCIGRGVAAFRYKTENTFSTYTYYKLRSLMARIKQFEDNGTVFGSIGKEDFNKLENVIAPKELVKKFQQEASPLDKKIYQNTIQIRTLTQLRDTLLPKLMNGEVRVGEN
ncbi:MAG: restriction endonuclease subunit S [bacterium]